MKLPQEERQAMTTAQFATLKATIKDLVYRLVVVTFSTSHVFLKELNLDGPAQELSSTSLIARIASKKS